MASAHPVVGTGLRDWTGRHETLATGLVTGGAGAVAMMAVAVVGAVSEGLTPLHPAAVIGEAFVGPGALGGVAGHVVFGLAVHLVTSVALGILLAAVLPRDFPLASAIGVGVGFVLLSFMFVLMPLVVPLAHPGFRAGMQAIGGAWIVALAVFGAVLGTGPSLRRWAARDAPREERVGVATPHHDAPSAARVAARKA